MKKLLVALLALGMLAACKSKSKKTGDALTFEDFRELFTQTALPYKLAPDTLRVKLPDSAAIKPALLKQFLTDTLAKGDFSGATPRYFPLAYIKGALVDYFVVKAATKSATVAYLCFTDKKGHYLNSITAGRLGGEEQQYFSIDSRNVVKLTSEKQLRPGQTATKEDFYAVDAAGILTLIMTNSNQAAIAGEVFNPIDTLPRKHKLSGDYTSGESNIVSIRDGEEPKSFLFFISFTKEKGACKGELSGTGHFTGANKGEYKDKESGCGLAFQFFSGRVSIRETGGCGAYRGVRCFFEGSFTRKKK